MQLFNIFQAATLLVAFHEGFLGLGYWCIGIPIRVVENSTPIAPSSLYMTCSSDKEISLFLSSSSELRKLRDA